VSRESSSAAKLRSAAATTSLVTFRSKCTGFDEGRMEKAPIPDLCTVWEASIVTEEQIQALADRRLLRPKSQVGWRPAAGEEFPTDGTGETVVFLTHIKRGFNVPTGDFLRRLLHFYRIKLVHLAPNSITIISTFVHLYEAYLDTAPHFHLWRHFFELKKTSKGVVISSVSFMLRQIMKSEYIDLILPDNTTDWKQGWFYLDNPTPALKERTRCMPVPYRNGPTSWHHGTARSCIPCWMTWSSSRQKGLPTPWWLSASAAASSNLSRTRPIRPWSTRGNPTPLSSRSARSPRRR
jgi:hypothetical protein